MSRFNRVTWTRQENFSHSRSDLSFSLKLRRERREGMVTQRRMMSWAWVLSYWFGKDKEFMVGF